MRRMSRATYGAGAALVKITTFMVFLIPAGLVTAGLMGRGRAAGLGGAVRVGGAALAAIAVPIAAGAWWTRFADAVKRGSASTQFLESVNLIGFNFGTMEERFSPQTWVQHWQNLSHGIAAPLFLVVAVLVTASVARARWRAVVLCAACYVAPLVIFPVLYSRHDYYGVANALFLLVAGGLAIAALWEVRPRALVWLALAVVHASQLWAYRQTYFELQERWSPGGSELTKTVRAMTNPKEVLVTAGFDWDSSLPFYAQRRALMIRSGRESDLAYLEQAFRDQAGQPVAIFVAKGERGADPRLLRLVEQHFDIDPRPILRWRDETVFGRKDRRAIMVDAVRRTPAIPEVQLDPSTANENWSMMGREMRYAELLEADRLLLAVLGRDHPVKLFTEFGLSPMEHDGRSLLFAHAETRFWFAVPAGRSVVRVEFCVMPGAYEGPERDRSDGVEFVIEEEKADGARTRLKSVFLDPNRRPEDRSIHAMEVTVERTQPGLIVVSSGPGPHGNKARDWSAFASVRIARADERR